MGFEITWTDDEALAYCDDGALARGLGLGSGEMTAVQFASQNGISGSGVTRYDSILKVVPADVSPMESGLCKRGTTKKGGRYDMIRLFDQATIPDYGTQF
jgi:hypothetical protein